MAKYGRRLTKEQLIEGGITNITEDGRVWRNDIEIEHFSLNRNGYKIIIIYDRDENGNFIKIPGKRPGYYTYKSRTITLNRAMLAWFNGAIEEGLVADHIDGNKNNYHISNLQAISPIENIAKSQHKNYQINVKETKCNMHKPKSYYETKLEIFLQQYENAKAEGNAEKTHHLRSKISHTRARLRYWESHKEEYEEYIAFKNAEEGLRDNWKQNIKDRKLLEQYKQMFKEAGNKAMWHQMCKVIKAWDQLDSLQKEHVFEVLHRFFSKD